MIQIQVSAHRCQHLTISRIINVVIQFLSQLELASHKINYTLGATVCPKTRVKHFPVRKCKLGPSGKPRAECIMTTSVHSFTASLESCRCIVAIGKIVSFKNISWWSQMYLVSIGSSQRMGQWLDKISLSDAADQSIEQWIYRVVHFRAVGVPYRPYIEVIWYNPSVGGIVLTNFHELWSHPHVYNFFLI